MELEKLFKRDFKMFFYSEVPTKGGSCMTSSNSSIKTYGCTTLNCAGNMRGSAGWLGADWYPQQPVGAKHKTGQNYSKVAKKLSLVVCCLSGAGRGRVWSRLDGKRKSGASLISRVNLFLLHVSCCNLRPHRILSDLLDFLIRAFRKPV